MHFVITINKSSFQIYRFTVQTDLCYVASRDADVAKAEAMG